MYSCSPAAIVAFSTSRRAVISAVVDCMIAAVAWRHGATMLAHDRDIDQVARVIGIDVDDAGRPAV